MGWEEKDKYVEFPLVRLGQREAIFDGVTYKLQDDGRLRATVKLRDQKTGEIREKEFFYQPRSLTSIP